MGGEASGAMCSEKSPLWVQNVATLRGNQKGLRPSLHLKLWEGVLLLGGGILWGMGLGELGVYPI